MKNNQKGFTFIEIMLLLIFVTLVGFIGWFVIDANQDKTPTQSQTQATSIVDKTNTSNSSVLKIPKLGIQLTVPSELKGINYTVEGEYVGFYMADLDELANSCVDKGPMPINMWTKVSGEYQEYPGTGLIKQFDGFYIVANGGPNGRQCSIKAVTDLHQKYATALYEARTSVQLIK
jgi:hypothetical protein